MSVIVMDLECPQGHRFEGWFASPEEFGRQNDLGMVTCPVCNTHPVRRLPSAVHLASSSGEAAPIQPEQLLGQLLDTLREVAGRAEDLGAAFVTEARRIHAGETEARPIKGFASAADAITLLEEGISVLPLPPAKEDLH